jgi:hypothetical protein
MPDGHFQIEREAPFLTLGDLRLTMIEAGQPVV